MILIFGKIMVGIFACFGGWYAFQEGKKEARNLLLATHDTELKKKNHQFFELTIINFSFSVVGWTIGTHLILREIEIFLGAF